LLKAGAKFRFPSIHAHANGHDTTAHLEIGLKFHPRGYVPTKTVRSIRVGTSDLDLNGMEANQSADAYYALPENYKLTTFEPHLHAAGVRMCLEAIWGDTVWTLSCAGYDHNWVRVYTYADNTAPLLPKGTVLHVSAYFDTTPANRNVADPRNWSGIGQRSVDNMMSNLGWGMPLSDQEFKEEIARRRSTLNSSGQNGPDISCPLCSVAPTTN